MNVKDVQGLVDEVARNKADDEHAHGLEDEMYRSVLAAIADGAAEDPAGMARLALSAGDIEFARWRA